MARALSPRRHDLEPERLVFIDETWTATNMTCSHGRCAKGERLQMGFPHGHRKTTTLVAGLRMTARRWCWTGRSTMTGAKPV